MTTCSICGGQSFTERAVLWPALIEAWQLAPHEVSYIDRQQGCLCSGCGANLRAVALGLALQQIFGTEELLGAFVTSEAARSIRLLEVNEAHTLTASLRRLPGHTFAGYPQVDLQHLPYADGSFDVVVHSDTLEHVPDALQALRECRRVLRPGGALCFTVPIVVGRLSRSRAGLPPSWHGDASTGREDFLVQTEFGADAWTLLPQAGFDRVVLTPVEFPTAVALTALRDDGGAAIRARRQSEEQLQTLETELGSLRASKSWWVTAPLRAAAHALRRLKHS